MIGFSSRNNERYPADFVFWSATVTAWYLIASMKVTNVLSSVFEKMKKKIEEYYENLSGFKALIIEFINRIARRGNQAFQDG